MNEADDKVFLLQLQARLRAAARSTLALPRAELTADFWRALNGQQQARPAGPARVVVPLDVFMTLRNRYPDSFPTAQVPLTQQPLTPLSVLYPQQQQDQQRQQEFFEVLYDDLALTADEANDLAAIRAAVHSEHNIDVAGSTLSVAAKKQWDPPIMWEVLPWSGAADAFSVDDCCVFKLVDRPPPPPQPKEPARPPQQQFPTLKEILREDEWKEVLQRCEEIDRCSRSTPTCVATRITVPSTAASEQQDSSGDGGEHAV